MFKARLYFCELRHCCDERILHFVLLNSLLLADCVDMEEDDFQQVMTLNVDDSSLDSIEYLVVYDVDS